MRKLICILLLFSLLTACAPSEEAIQTAVAGTLTAAPTATASITPSPQPTATQTATQTSTPLPTATSTPASLSGQPGWQDYALSGFYLSLPPEWQAMEVDEESMEALLKMAEAMDDPAVQGMLKMFSSGGTFSFGGAGAMPGLSDFLGGMGGDMGGLSDFLEGMGDMGGMSDFLEGMGDLGGMAGMTGMFEMEMRPEMKFFAMDAGPEAAGQAVTIVMNMSLPFSMESSMLCTFMPTYFSQMGMKVVDQVCGLEHNGLDGGFFETTARFGETDFRQHLFFLLDGKEMWMLTMAVEEDLWADYEPIFGNIAKSFGVGEPPQASNAAQMTTPAVTATPTPTPATATTGTAESNAGQTGWVEYPAGNFSISLPAEWQAVDVDKEGMEKVFQLVEGLDSPLAEEILETMLSGDMASMDMADSMKFWAMDAGPEASGNATVNVLMQSLPIPMGSSMLCRYMPRFLEQMGFTVEESECGLERSGLDGGRFETTAKLGETEFRLDMYFYVNKGDVWILSLGVEETRWPKYETVFTEIEESFEAGQ